MAALLRLGRLGRRVAPALQGFHTNGSLAPLSGAMECMSEQKGFHSCSALLPYSGAVRASVPIKVQSNSPHFRMIAKTQCNFGNTGLVTIIEKNQGVNPRMIIRPISTTKEKLPLNVVHTGQTTRYMKTKAFVQKFVLRLLNELLKSWEGDFVKMLGQYISAGFALSIAWIAYKVFSALGLDDRILDNIIGHGRVVSQENKAALKVLSEILERKDRRWESLDEENKKMREESERAGQAHRKEVADLKAAIHSLQESERRNKKKKVSEKDEQSRLELASVDLDKQSEA